MEKDNKYQKIMRCLDRWMTERENNNSISKYLKKKNINCIGIYGYGILGRHLLYELCKDNSIEIAWIMDKRANAISEDFQILGTETEVVPEADAIIITALCDFEEIEAQLCRKINCLLIPLSEIIDEMKFFREKVSR